MQCLLLTVITCSFTRARFEVSTLVTAKILGGVDWYKFTDISPKLARFCQSVRRHTDKGKLSMEQWWIDSDRGKLSLDNW